MFGIHFTRSNFCSAEFLFFPSTTVQNFFNCRFLQLCPRDDCDLLLYSRFLAKCRHRRRARIFTKPGLLLLHLLFAVAVAAVIYYQSLCPASLARPRCSVLLLGRAEHVPIGTQVLGLFSCLPACLLDVCLVCASLPLPSAKQMMADLVFIYYINGYTAAAAAIFR